MIATDQKSLTDFEVIGLSSPINLADGHAYQDMPIDLATTVTMLPQIWETAEHSSHESVEQKFFDLYAQLSLCTSLTKKTIVKRVCPTASNSIDIVAAYLGARQLHVSLIEPTFDNLYLLLKRRGVPLAPLAERMLDDDQQETLNAQLKQFSNNALFIVNPNNPSGKTLSAQSLSRIAQCCARYNILLIIDNSFRFQKRNHFDDYQILLDSGCSFITFEDTGKVWPLQDMKASLLACSLDVSKLLSTIYFEIYLCVSPFTLAVINQFIQSTLHVGLAKSIWSVIDARRRQLRSLFPSHKLEIDPTGRSSTLSVEWLHCLENGKSDLDVVTEIHSFGLSLLPGRNFFWSAQNKTENQRNIRLSLLKKEKTFRRGMKSIVNYINSSL